MTTNFNDHITTICTKAACQLNALGSLANVLSVDDNIILFDSHITIFAQSCGTLLAVHV